MNDSGGNLGRIWAGIRNLRNRVFSTYWFVPGTIIAFGGALATIMLDVDDALPTKYVSSIGWVYTRDPAGAREILGVISQSMITVAGVVFSITVVALTMASNQFGTRVLRTFIRDIANQVVLGAFLATFLYGVLVMRRVESNPAFVPSISVAVGIFLAIANTVLLVYFIHHIVSGVEAESVVAVVAADVQGTIEELFPEKLGQGGAEQEPRRALPDDFDREGCDVLSPAEGYVRMVRSHRLLRLASEHDLLVRLELRPGDFVSEGIPLLRAYPRAAVTPEVAQKLAGTYAISKERTYEQDLPFALQQLVLMGVRALSPAMNAYGTAIDSIDRLGAALLRLGNRKFPSPYRFDDEGKLRVVAHSWDPRSLVNLALDPVREAATASALVLGHLVQVVGMVARHVQNPAMEQALRAQLAQMAQAAAHLPQAADRATMERVLAAENWRNRAA